MAKYRAYRAPLGNSEAIHLIEHKRTPEQKLWVSVLAKAFDDAFNSTDESAALEALGWIKHGMDFNAVCRMAGRDGDYVKSRMLDKVIEREATLLDKHYRIRQGTWANE